MANSFDLTLDTTGPASPMITIESGATTVSAQVVNCQISVGDGVTTSYQMKIWGDIDLVYNPNIQGIEANSAWIGYAITQQIKLSTPDGAKTVYLKIRDDVNNESAVVSDGATLDTSLPVITVTGPDVLKISKQTGRRTANISFSVDSDISEYKVKFVASAGAAQDTGVSIGAVNGSTNTSKVGLNPALAVNAANSGKTGTVYSVSIDGADLEAASAGDGIKKIKVFVKESPSGSWSV